MWQSLMIFFTQECAYRGNRGLFLIFVPYICAQNVSGQKILRLKDSTPLVLWQLRLFGE